MAGHDRACCGRQARLETYPGQRGREGAGVLDALQKHPVPLWDHAIRKLQNNSMGLDAYTWLAYRLHALKKPTPVHWARLHQQFGAGFKTVRQFKATFLANLKLAMAVYPKAKVEADPAG